MSRMYSATLWRIGHGAMAHVALGHTRTGRYLRVVYVPDEGRRSAFVITAYPVSFKVVRALRRRHGRGS